MNNFLILEQEAVSPTTSIERLRELAQQNENLALLVARNPHAPSEILQELAYKYEEGSAPWGLNPDWNPDIIQAIVSNPNTPKDILLSCGADFPQQLLKNPVFDLLLLENPNLVAEMPFDTLKSLLMLESVPELLLERALKRKETEVRKKLAQNINISRIISKTLAQNIDIIVRSLVALNPKTPVSLLKILAQDSDATVRRHVIYNPKTPVSLLKILAQDFNAGIRCAVAINPDTPVSLLEILAQDTDVEVRNHVASNSNTPVNLLEILAQDTDVEVRYRVKLNPHTPQPIKARLAQDISLDSSLLAQNTLKHISFNQ